MTGLTRLGSVTVNAAGDDFVMWVQDTFTGTPPVEVRRASLNPLTSWEGGFNNAWVGPDMVEYIYPQDHLTAVGVPARVEVRRDGQVVFNMAIPQAGPAGPPAGELWGWDHHWAFEVENVVVQDGELQNLKLGLDEMFDWRLVDGKPFYFFRKGTAYGLAYDGQPVPLSYEDLLHGQLCCDAAHYRIASLSNGAWFYGLRDGTWYLVFVELNA